MRAGISLGEFGSIVSEPYILEVLSQKRTGSALHYNLTLSLPSLLAAIDANLRGIDISGTLLLYLRGRAGYEK